MNREEVAMNLTFENLDILRKEVQAAKLLLSECDKVLEEDGGVYIELRAFLSGKMSADDVIALLASQQGEQVKHPEQAEGAQGERERFEVEMLELCLPIERDSHGAYVSDHVRHLWSGWELRAALAQPSPAPELERPEVVGRRCTPSAEMAAVQAYRKEPWVDDRITEQPSLPGFYSVEPLMTVAQHERIVESLQAEVLSWRETVRFNESCWAEERGVMIDKIQTIRGGIPLAIAAIEDGAVMITGIEDRLFKALSEHTHWKRKTASLELYAAPVAQAGQVPEGVRAWFEAKLAHVNAVDAYNARLKFVREHCPFGTSVDPEYQLMEEADRKARSLVGPMFDELRGLLAAAPAQGGE